ncbi:glycosyltransferase [Evansella sp. LMS18]|uniref:glycosyltransferase family 2 protein n=1 Tax=Evansella sp. LMS18 TaxID=2924033 RepID=UPI0020D107FE|nr:glycosyltransferase [Evansella sp. LMS18]UTR10577.1 glycosyltransferase [Evansella sp. LMS18]
MLKPKVSVIVPIYKVEKYIHRCLESILNQSYTNLDIILVNDGSPDSCGSIADEYALANDRVRAYHKENGGLSDARNYGMNYAEGTFTMFVDSDDWIEPEMVEELVRAALDYKADVVQSAFYYAHDTYHLFDNRYFSRDGSTSVLNNKELMNELVINERVKNFAWGKLYKTSLIRSFPFKKGVLFEDVFWAHNIMHQVSTYVIVNKPLYNYYQRDDSIVATYTPKNLDIIKGLKERHSFIEIHYPDLVNESYKMLLKTNLEHYKLLTLNKRKDPEGSHRKEIQSYINSRYRLLKKAAENDRRLMRQLNLFHIHPLLNISYLAAGKFTGFTKLTQRHQVLERVNL